jgi:L-cystine transport system substrate-binding protein
MEMNQRPTNKFAIGAAFALSVLALVTAIYSVARTPPGGVVAGEKPLPGVLARLSSTGEIDAGYGVYPPYSIEDPNTRKVSGFSVDLMEEIARQLGAKVVWHRINWDTMSADLKRGEFDVIADPIFQTIPRAPEFAFSDVYARFPDGIGVVRKNETRFPTFESVDQQGVTVNVGLGQASEALVRSRFTLATIAPVPATTDNMRIFQDVLAGRADIAIADLPNAERIVQEHSDQLKLLWADDAPASMPAGFALRPTDADGARFFSVALRYLNDTGVIDALRRKYNLPVEARN